MSAKSGLFTQTSRSLSNEQEKAENLEEKKMGHPEGLTFAQSQLMRKGTLINIKAKMKKMAQEEVVEDFDEDFEEIQL